ncbi:hypothetical protein GGR52DRAFT_499222 [Hypoxylon sp. FL1284]|nr:hypothetical protein GGR52DRAFT_499222 [Hypoxylon sp. FL1284]
MHRRGASSPLCLYVLCCVTTAPSEPFLSLSLRSDHLYVPFGFCVLPGRYLEVPACQKGTGASLLQLACAGSRRGKKEIGRRGSVGTKRPARFGKACLKYSRCIVIGIDASPYEVRTYMAIKPRQSPGTRLGSGVFLGREGIVGKATSWSPI